MVLDVWAIMEIAVKFLMYVTLLMSAGTVFYGLWILPKPLRLNSENAEIIRKHHVFVYKVLIGATVSGMVFALASYAIRVVRMMGDASALLQWDLIVLLWETPVGTVLAWRLGGLFVIALGLLFMAIWCVHYYKGEGLTPLPLQAKILLMIGASIVALSFAKIGHTTGDVSGRASVLIVVHIVGIALWVGVLWPLYWLAGDHRYLQTTAHVAHRFGKLASFFVPVLLVVGVIIVGLLVADIPSQLNTNYMQTLGAKIVGILMVLGLALLNKVRIVPKIQAGEIKALHHLRVSLLVESTLILGVILITSALTSVMTLPSSG